MHWTKVPCKLKILKLFIKELGNITEGEESGTGENGEGGVGAGGDENVWEDSDDGSGGFSSDDEWEDVGSGSNDPDDTTSQQNILKGVDTKVLSPLCSVDYRRLLLTF